MSKIERTWPIDSVDAISILALDGEFKIEGTDGDQIQLEGEFESRFGPDLNLEPANRWLQIQLWNRPGENELTLSLPKKKAWVVDLSAARGEVGIEDVKARLRVMLGKGEIQIENCEGSFNLASGKGEVQMKHCRETEVPERPPRPPLESPFASDAPFEAPPFAKGKGPSGEFRFSFGRHHEGIRPRGRGPWDWDWDWDWNGNSEEWAQWGARFGEQARAWAQQFAGQFFGQAGWLAEQSGIGMYVGKGEAQLENIEAKACVIKIGNGEAQLEDGRIENLEVVVGHGNIHCESVLPVGNWKLECRHGEIQLALPADTQARLDVATRHGDIDSEIPLVRVGRPGPGARHGGRMVGTVGQTEGVAASQIDVSATSGDIQIELQREKSRYPGSAPSAAPAAASTPAAEPPPAAAQPVAQAATVTAPAVATATAGPAETATTQAQAEATQAPAAPMYDSQLAILQALSEGHISVQEAEKLLQALYAQQGGQRPLWEFLKSLAPK